MEKLLIRRQIVLSLLFIVPLGFLFKIYSGPGRWWFNDYGAGIIYEIFWILAVFLFLPHKRAVDKIPICVFVGTGILEILQLWHPGTLEYIRSSFLGRALVGTTFVWWDFPHYAVGCLIGWIWMRQILKHHL